MINTGLNINYTRPDASRHMKYVACVNSVDFHGSDDGLTIDDDTDFSPTDGSNNDLPFSISCWVNQHATGTSSSANGLLFGKGTGSSTKEYKLFLHYGQLMFDIVDNQDNNYYRVIGPAQTLNNPAVTWYHIVATYDGSEASTGLRIYKDGEQLSTTSGGGGSYSGIDNTNSKVAIGCRLDNANYDLNGSMSDIMFWKDYCLSQEEITQIYNDGQYSVDPTVDTGDYAGAAYCKLWLKCDANITMVPATTNTTYQIVDEAKCEGAMVVEGTDLWNEECAGLTNAGTEGTVCCILSETVAAVLGIEDFSGNDHDATYNGNGVTLNSSCPTATSVTNEYDTF
tara:strand:- start:358 stop:1377 length:1020 start_codon:yes stop_codon:yes gene_type:complete